ncbi:glycosyltransferase [Pontibacter populi]|uniref:Glycosyltransferase n=1 Tax=Pontibacter populi TaxID=890055 RepID=A0ABV1RPZ0_9BACT
MKATVLHIIESLVMGGAEVLLTESLKGFSDQYRHVVVYMRPPVTLLPEVKADKIYCLNYSGKYSLLKCAYRLKQIIKKEKIDLIHAHHYWPTLVSRLAKHKNIPLIFTVHNALSKDAFELNRLSYYAEKLTYSGNNHVVFVSEAVYKDYDRTIGVKGKADVIYNFVSDQFYDADFEKTESQVAIPFRLVAVATLKDQKNYPLLLAAMELLKDDAIHLDIIGSGPLWSELQNMIATDGLEKVKLKGEQSSVHKLLHQYDGFIQASSHEGFGIAMVEAMAIGLPCILSDIETHKEITAGNALFFDPKSPEECAAKIKVLRDNLDLRNTLMGAGKVRARAFRKQVYLDEIEALYQQYLT